MSRSEPSARSVETRAFPTDAEAAESVFITPRVLDQGAFREYADSLKGLIREAGGRRTELRTDAEEARQLSENLAEAANRLRERLETTAKLLPALDNRVKRAEQVMALAEENMNLPALLEERIGKHVAAMESRVKAMISAADARLATIETRYKDLHDKAEADLARLEGIGADLSASADRATEALTGAAERTAALRAEVEEIAAGAGGRLEARAETLVARADQAFSTLNAGVSGVLADADKQVAAISAQIAPFLSSADSIPDSMKQHLDHALAVIDAHAEQTMKRARAVEMLNDRAVRLLGFDPDEPSDEVAPDSLMMLVQHGDALERKTRATAEELAALHAANEQACHRLAETAQQSESTVESLVRRRDELIASVERALGALADQEPDYLEQVLKARDALTEIERRRTQVEMGMGELSGELAALEHGVAEQLEALRRRAGEELAALSEAVAAQRRSLTESGGGSGAPDQGGEPESA